MKLLVLGGTVFLGKHIVSEALAQGHEVTIFHRGTHPSPFKNVEEILGDRNSDLDKLRDRRWDAVIDTSAYVPEVVERSAKALKNAVDRYVFISTISVYSDLSAPGITEGSTLATLSDPTERAITGETYGALKVLCENVVREVFNERTLILRPGLIVGPDDPSGRFTYWPLRIREGGDVLVPGEQSGPVQFVDVRDLAIFTLKQIEQRTSGTVHVTGPAHPLTMQDFVEACQSSMKSDANFVWVTQEFLESGERLGEAQIPIWLPHDYVNMNHMDITKAVALGLIFRPLEETIIDTLEWVDGTARKLEWPQFLSREREQQLVKEARNSDQEV